MSTVHVAPPSDGWEGWEHHFIHFHNFANLPSKKDHVILSPSFKCFDSEWRLHIFPGGDASTLSGEVSIYLKHCSETEHVAAFNILIKDKAGKVCCEKLTTFNKFQNGGTWGWSDFVSRSSIIGPSNDVLNHGTLTTRMLILGRNSDSGRNSGPADFF